MLREHKFPHSYFSNFFNSHPIVKPNAQFTAIFKIQSLFTLAENKLQTQS